MAAPRAVDRAARTVTVCGQRETTLPYDDLVFASGSSPFVPPVPGKDAPGCFVYRTLEDLEAIRAEALKSKVGVVIGGGLLGLEAAGALRKLGLETHVVEFAPQLMPAQLDEGGGAVLRGIIEAMGIGVHTAKATSEITQNEAAKSAGWPSRTARTWPPIWWCSRRASGPATIWPAPAACKSASAAAL